MILVSIYEFQEHLKMVANSQLITAFQKGKIKVTNLQTVHE